LLRRESFAFEETLVEPLALLLLPSELEQFDRREHARELLEIPRVVALEPSRRRAPRWLRDTIPMRQVKRLRLPGEPRMLVLYHPAQYPLARGLRARYNEAELWYVRPGPETLVAEPTYTREELLELDQLAAERAAQDKATEGLAGEDLRLRLRELGVISHRPFVPGARIDAR
jgi:hypothetical protein